MDLESPPTGILPEDWAATPLAVRQFLAALLTVVTLQQQQLAQLQQENADLRQRLTDLEARLNQHSQNSSKPPSSDPPSAPPRPVRVPRGRKAGGQPGHPRHDRPDPDPDHIDHVRDHYPPICPTCQIPLAHGRQDACAVQTQYVWDLPLVRPEITAHHYHTVCCPSCGDLVTAERPADVPPGGTQRVPGPPHRRGHHHLARGLYSHRS
jgi:transposase